MNKKREYIQPQSAVYAVCAECQAGPVASGSTGGPGYGGAGSSTGGGGMNGAKGYTWSSFDDESEMEEPLSR